MTARRMKGKEGNEGAEGRTRRCTGSEQERLSTSELRLENLPMNLGLLFPTMHSATEFCVQNRKNVSGTS